MATRVDTQDAQAHLPEYVDRAASRGERILLERDGQPIAALVSVDDLRRLESSLWQHEAPVADDTARLAKFRQAMEASGLVTRWRSGPPPTPDKRRPLQVAGPPLSEQIVAERR